MNSLRLFFSLAFLTLFSVLCAATEPVGSVYRGEAMAMVWMDDGSFREETVPVRFIVERGEEDTSKAAACRLEATIPPKTTYLRVRSEDLPSEAASAFDGQPLRLFSPDTSRDSETEVAIDLFDQGPEVEVQIPRWVTLLDAEGRPLANVEAGFSAYRIRPGTADTVRLATVRSDSEGRVANVFAPAGRHLNRMHNFGYKLEVIIPSTGQVHWLDFPKRTGIGDQQFVTQYQLPVSMDLPTTESEKSRTFSGRIVDEAGQPVEGASIRMETLSVPKPWTRSQINGDSTTARVGKSGNFELRLPASYIEPLPTTGEVLPDDARLYVEVGTNAARGLGNPDDLLAEKAQLSSSGEAVIPLETGKRLLFKFLDIDGNVIETGNPVSAQVFLDQYDEEGNRVSHTSMVVPWKSEGIIETQPVQIPGTYGARFYRTEYAPREITAEMAGEVIEWRPEEKLVSLVGRVIDVTTGQPIPGAYVSETNNGNHPWPQASLTEEERRAIWDGVPADGTGHPIPAELFRNGSSVLRVGQQGSRKWIGARLVAITDESGFFRLHLPFTEKPGTVVVKADGKIPMSLSAGSLYSSTKPEDGVLALADCPLIPAANGVIRTEAPESIPRFSFPEVVSVPESVEEIDLETGFRLLDTEDWASEPTAHKTSEDWDYVISSRQERPGEVVETFLPAGVRFDLWLSCWFPCPLISARWKDQAPLSVGDHVDFGTVRLKAKQKVEAVVLYQNGTPAPGLRLAASWVIDVTDVNGVGDLMVNPGEPFEVIVTLPPGHPAKTDEHLLEKTIEPGPEGSVPDRIELIVPNLEGE